MSLKSENSVTEQIETLVTRIDELETLLNETLGKVTELSDKVTELTTPKQKSLKEMTNNDALRILTGDCKDLKHNEAAQKLGLSYGQIYSCRLEFTFRHITEKIRKEDPNWVNPWKSRK